MMPRPNCGLNVTWRDPSGVIWITGYVIDECIKEGGGAKTLGFEVMGGGGLFISFDHMSTWPA